MVYQGELRCVSALVDGWARVVGHLSRPHLDRVIDTFRVALKYYDDVSNRVNEAKAHLVGMLRYLRACLPQLQHETLAEENRSRMRKLLELHREMTSRRKRGVDATVSLVECQVLDLILRQCEGHIPGDPSDIDGLYAYVGKLSRTALVKSSALKLMVSILQRSPDSLYDKHFWAFFTKRILSHLKNPQKADHCLEIVGRVFSGLYQGEKGLHPRVLDPNFRACAFSARVPATTNIIAMLESTFSALTKRKALHLAFTRDPEALVAVFVQMAVNDMEYVAEHMLKPMMKMISSSPLCVLVALRTLRYIQILIPQV